MQRGRTNPVLPFPRAINDKIAVKDCQTRGTSDVADISVARSIWMGHCEGGFGCSLPHTSEVVETHIHATIGSQRFSVAFAFATSRVSGLSMLGSLPVEVSREILVYLNIDVLCKCASTL